MDWRLARSLVVLRDEVNRAYPGRPTGSDGTIGDTAHSSRTSDHNPNSAGVVCAIDLTEWVQNGVEMNDRLAEFLREKRDSRLKYVISDGRMFSSYSTDSRPAWQWGPYSGINAHTQHVHVSVHGAYDDPRPWGIINTLEDWLSATAEQQIAELHAAVITGGPPLFGPDRKNLSLLDITRYSHLDANGALVAARAADAKLNAVLTLLKSDAEANKRLEDALAQVLADSGSNLSATEVASELLKQLANP